MAKYIVNRLFAMLITLWIIVTITFFLMHAVPGSPFNQERNTSEAVQQNLEAHYHLDEPVFIQYAIYIKSLATLDFGPSIKQSSTSVNEMIGRGFPVSAELGITSLLIAIISGMILGIMAALKHNGAIDYIAMTLAVIGISVPNFIMATLLIQQLAVYWEIFPVATWASPIHMVLPSIALATGPMAIIARLTRSSMIEVLNQDYILTARAKGMTTFQIVTKHAMRNALLPVITILGTLVAGVLTGSFVIEKIFAIPGMGKYFINGINDRDYPVIMGTTVFYSAFLILMLFIVDIVYGILDPRIKLHKRGN
ncbi:ABC transporter permease [Pseudalkalibacillus hwajinpoensis]|uniref:ABC transporter permease n=1 Tax=Guptibacillus hwajinpoensis TaxID=208199 RepID=UPI00325BEB28